MYMTQHHQGFRGVAGVYIGHTDTLKTAWYDVSMSEYGKNYIKMKATPNKYKNIAIYPANIPQCTTTKLELVWCYSIGPTLAQLWLAVTHLITYKNSKIGRYGIDIK